MPRLACDSLSTVLLPDFTSSNLSQLQPFLCGCLKSCVIIPSICFWACQYAKQASAMLSRQQQLLERWRGGRWRVKKRKMASYLQSSNVYPISGQAGE